MKTAAELDAEYAAWLAQVDAALVIRRRIIAAGEMATKTRVEDELMPLYPGMDRYAAHRILNHIEYRNLR